MQMPALTKIVKTPFGRKEIGMWWRGAAGALPLLLGACGLPAADDAADETVQGAISENVHSIAASKKTAAPAGFRSAADEHGDVRIKNSAPSGLIVKGTGPELTGLWQFSDSFEGNPWARWEGFQGGDGVPSFDIKKGLARSGYNNGWLYTARGWAAERIGHNISGWTRYNCAAAIYVQPVNGGAQVGLEIWDPNGWRKIASTYPWVAGPGYQQVYITGLDLRGLTTVYIQAIYGSSSGIGKYIRLDDVMLQCYY